MRPMFRALSLALFLVVSAAQGFAQALPQDPSLVTGQLDNGLRYIVRQHAVPPGHATVWCHIHSGSLNESDRQRGIAHYLEHMAFNGSENFAPGTLVPFFQSLGMTFGRDQNAFTNMQETTYQLTLPNTKPETLSKGMTFFADVVGRLSLLPKEVDAERQIIQEERRRGLSGQQRVRFYVTERMIPGSIYGQRITIGTEETINGVNEQDFKDYYGKWYAASNATLMVVADAPPAEVVKAIKDTFSALPKRARPTPQELGIKAYEKSFAIVASDPEIRGDQVRIVRAEPARPAVTTVPLLRNELVIRLGEVAFNRRLEEKAAAGGTAYTGGRVNTGNQSGVLYTAELSGRANAGKWQAALEQLALELQRARAFGFTQRELDDVRKELISGAERAVETESTTPTGGIIARINSDVGAGETILSPKQRLELLKQQLPTITSEEVAKRFAAEFDPKAVAFIATLPSGPDVPSEAKLLEIGTKALAAKPSQETEAAARPAAAALLAEAPKPGTWTEQGEHAASKVWSGWLSNNARVHYRFMDERKNQATIHIALVGGELLETKADRGITSAAQLAWSRPATKHLSSTEIREFMTGRKVNVRGGGFGGGGGRGGRGGGGGGGGGGDTIALTVSGSPEELETGMQLAYLLLTEPKIEAPSFAQQQDMARQMLDESNRNAMGLSGRIVAAATYPEDEVRTRPPTAENLDRITLDAAQARLEKLIRESPIEVAIVGDLPKEKALELAARYVGSLPSRPRVSSAAFADLRKLKRPQGPRVVEKSVKSQTDQAFVFSGFYGADESNIPDTRALNMAARILSTRMVKEVREEAQLVYSIGAASRAGTTFPGFGVFSASAPTQPSKAPALIAKLESMYQAFATGGPTEEEMEVAKKQMANTWTEQMKDPATWLGRLQSLDLRGASLDDFMGGPGAYQAMTAKQVKDTFAKYYAKENTIMVTVKPDAAAPAEPDSGSN